MKYNLEEVVFCLFFFLDLKFLLEYIWFTFRFQPSEQLTLTWCTAKWVS